MEYLNLTKDGRIIFHLDMNIFLPREQQPNDKKEIMELPREFGEFSKQK
jgi:hypothetical protein